MLKSSLLEKFLEEVGDPLLKELIRVYSESLNGSDDERVSLLVAKLETTIEEYSNENPPA